MSQRDGGRLYPVAVFPPCAMRCHVERAALHSWRFPAARPFYILSLSYAPAAPIILFVYLPFLLFTFIIVNSKTILNEILIYSVSLAWTFSPLVYSFAHS